LPAIKYIQMRKTMIRSLIPLLPFMFLFSCDEIPEPVDDFMYGGDFSILKKMEDSGGTYKLDGVERDALEIFSENGYNYGRVRIFHTPNMVGPVCNSLEYTIALSKKIKAAGMKILLDFHYSDTWADPGHQVKPAAWEGLAFEVLSDSVYAYSKNVIEKMKAANVLPDMVQVGNEITPGMIWPDGKIYTDNGHNWRKFCILLNSGISGVNDAYGTDTGVPIMIHIDKGGDLGATGAFFTNIERYHVEYDVIGLSYYPWWHGTFDDLEQNLLWLSENKEQDIVIVETAYYSNGWYPEPAEWVLDNQPFPPDEQGQHDFLVELEVIARKYAKVKGIFYWKPDGLDIPASQVHYLGRSLFDRDGNAFKGISAFKKDVKE
jgi:arabinogalactan endo-1,4-beta-galactosidase